MGGDGKEEGGIRSLRRNTSPHESSNFGFLHIAICISVGARGGYIHVCVCVCVCVCVRVSFTVSWREGREDRVQWRQLKAKTAQ